MLSKEIEKVRQLVADAGDVAATVPEFDEFEKWARKWENGSRSRRSVVEALLEEALDKVAVVHARLFASGAVRANPIFDQLLSKEQRRARDRVIARVAKEARHGSGEPFKLPADFTLDKLLALPVHPAAQAFPMLEDSALKLLTEDIRRSRCRLPVDDRGDPEKSDRHELRQS
jgi:SpoVK/Ycf46/Vps4 family AAA+-type ATPase